MGVTVTFQDKLLTTYLHDSGIAIIPTDTVYGLVARAADPEAVRKLYSLKARESKPGTVIAAHIDQLAELGLKRRYLTAVERFWPNPISVIIPCGPELGYIHLGTYSIACRIPDDKNLVALLEKTGPLLSTSANEPGASPVGTISEAIRLFGEHINAYVDGGDRSRAKSSTVIRIVDDAIDVVREGAVQVDDAGRIKRS